MKKILLGLVVMMMSMLATTGYSASDFVVLKENSYLVLQNGETPGVVDTVSIVTAHKKGDTLFVPLRFVFESFGGVITWNKDTNSMDIKLPNSDAQFSMGSAEATISGVKTTLNTPIFDVAERSFLDIDTACKVLGTTYEVDGDGFIYIGTVSKDKNEIKTNYNNLVTKLDGNTATLILEDNFTESSKDNWVVETDGVGDQTIVKFGDGVLDTFTAKGLTIFNKKKFEGNYRIEFDGDFVVGGNEMERLSDFNFFWNANDPAHPEDIFFDSAKRGDFPTYNTMKLYYVGYGGNYNSSTRMRKYFSPERRVVGQYLFQPYLLTEGQTIHIKIEVIDGFSRVYRNNELIFAYYDTEPYTSGYFAFRTTINHVKFSNFKAYSLTR